MGSGPISLGRVSVFDRVNGSRHDPRRECDTFIADSKIEDTQRILRVVG
jgi:hypothetical protein